MDLKCLCWTVLRSLIWWWYRVQVLLTYNISGMMHWLCIPSALYLLSGPCSWKPYPEASSHGTWCSLNRCCYFSSRVTYSSWWLDFQDIWSTFLSPTCVHQWRNQPPHQHSWFLFLIPIFIHMLLWASSRCCNAVPSLVKIGILGSSYVCGECRGVWFQVQEIK